MTRVLAGAVALMVVLALGACNPASRSDGRTWRVEARPWTYKLQPPPLQTHFRPGDPPQTMPSVEVEVALTYLGAPGQVSAPRITLAEPSNVTIEPAGVSVEGSASDMTRSLAVMRAFQFPGETLDLKTGERVEGVTVVFPVPPSYERERGELALTVGDAPAIKLRRR